ncbi:MAG: hypothetical protein IPK68_09140 [Bdellovibrionales bacterium]|nr:hypothetical protein [Bdellovibrionales bacterium]
MRYLVTLIFIFLACWSLTNCKRSMNQERKIEAPSPTPEISTPAPVLEYASLSWEKSHPERRVWSSDVFLLIGEELFLDFDSAKDAKRICPKYESLLRSQKISMWAELISAIAYYESGWNPTSRMVETTMGTDPVTGKQVASEGLLQLSYQDVPNYKAVLKSPACKIDWQKDKELTITDAKKTIFDPAINLVCGLRILANQIQKKGYVILSSGVYWAVLKDGGKYSKVDSIIKNGS